MEEVGGRLVAKLIARYMTPMLTLFLQRNMVLSCVIERLYDSILTKPDNSKSKVVDYEHARSVLNSTVTLDMKPEI